MAKILFGYGINSESYYLNYSLEKDSDTLNVAPNSYDLKHITGRVLEMFGDEEKEIMVGHIDHGNIKCIPEGDFLEALNFIKSRKPNLEVKLLRSAEED